ncbi:outer membrane protein [uncultured Rhodoblastus sp.]|uniref:outer membrane protein n=1 Tax=uncultured Rhodoblastus sp. TaxID=543037 RepID=UPI0025DD8F96|nr:outer membrane protein [uncultured Rhodoblastus sp.]
MRNFLLSTVALAALAGQAFAADLPSRKEAPVYIAPAPIYSWTGFYAGVDIGGSWGNANLWVPGTIYTFSHNATNNGVIGGGFIGYNYQVNNFVFGLQGEFDGTGTGNSRYTAPALGLFNYVYQSSFNQNWIASIDGRLGYAIDRTLIYALGGVAWSDNSAHLNNLSTGAGWSTNNTRTGYDVGGGVEYAFTNNWTGRIEYRYYNFGTDNTTGIDNYLGNTFYRTTLTNNVVRVGLAYKFGAPEPVVAKY